MMFLLSSIRSLPGDYTPRKRAADAWAEYLRSQEIMAQARRDPQAKVLTEGTQDNSCPDSAQEKAKDDNNRILQKFNLNLLRVFIRRPPMRKVRRG
jgi:hypothetical protein